MYRQEEDTLGDFLQDCCTFHERAYVRASALYERYKAWTTANNLRALNGKLFGLEMKKRVASQRDKRGMYYQGIGLVTDEEASDKDTEAVQGNGGAVESTQSASQADSDSKKSSTGVGYAGTCQKSPLWETQKCTSESLSKVPAYPTPVELTKISFDEPEKPVETAFERMPPPSSHPTPGGSREAAASSPEEQEYEEFDL